MTFLPDAFRIPKAFRIRKSIRDLRGLPECLGVVGQFEVRLATTKAEIRKAQRLRYKVFYELGGAHASPALSSLRRDICKFDRVCDHILIMDRTHVGKSGRIKPKVVGCYRVLRDDVALKRLGFYSRGEFDLGPMMRAHPGKRFLEIGRSCVHPKYRSKRVIDLLWKGLWTYALHHHIDIVFGCASFPGVDVRPFREALSYLHHHAAPTSDFDVKPIPGRGFCTNLVGAGEMQAERVRDTLPPLVRGYLRVGARFSRGAVVDRQFGTIDVFTILFMDEIAARYSDRFTRPIGRAA
ncbi:MAG: GNAT family N-acetyltransferase [Beijerinckiaceae bacterium]|nr:GNAT family N-acetyltransferase [Beijerinckiaceae bacterium]